MSVESGWVIEKGIGREGMLSTSEVVNCKDLAY